MTAYERPISDWSSDVCPSDLRSANAVISKQFVLQPGKHEITVRLPASVTLKTLCLICEPCAKDAMLLVTTIHPEPHVVSTSSNGSFSRVSLLGGRAFKHDSPGDAQPASPHSHAGSATVEPLNLPETPCDALMLVYERSASAVTAKDRYVAVAGG